MCTGATRHATSFNSGAELGNYKSMKGVKSIADDIHMLYKFQEAPTKCRAYQDSLFPGLCWGLVQAGFVLFVLCYQVMLLRKYFYKEKSFFMVL